MSAPRSRPWSRRRRRLSAVSPIRPRPQAALPSLDELKDKVDGLAAQVDQLPAEGKKLLAGVVSTALPPLKELAAKASSIQGADTVKPSIDVMLAKLEAWANAQG